MNDSHLRRGESWGEYFVRIWADGFRRGMRQQGRRKAPILVALEAEERRAAVANAKHADAILKDL